MLTLNESITVGVIAGVFVLLLSGRLASELVALLAMLTLGFAGVLTSDETLSGFSSPVVITLMGLFVITQALEDTGVIEGIARRIHNIGGGSEQRLLLLFMAAGATLSLVMNNVAAGAVLLPAAVHVGRISNVRLSKLLIPMSFGTLVGGMATYLTTANIIMSGLLEARDLPGLGMLDFIPTGGLIVLAGLVYMLLIGQRMLPERETLSQAAVKRPNLQETYQLDERMWAVRLLPDSRLIGVTLHDSDIGAELGLTVLAMWHDHRTILSPMPNAALLADDRLLVMGRQERVEQLLAWGAVLDGRDHDSDMLRRRFADLNLIEAIIPPRSAAIGKTLVDLDLRSQYKVTTIAIWRGGRSWRTDVGKFQLQVGDAMLVIGLPDNVARLAQSRDYMVPASGYPTRRLKRERGPLAVLITAVVLALAIGGVVSLPEVMLAGAVAMVLSGCLSMDSVYQAIEWRVIFLVAGMLPLSLAMAETGLAERVGSLMVDALAGANPLILVGSMFLVTTGITQIIGGQVTGLVIGPIAITAALQIGVDPRAMAVAVAIGCSTAFLTPIAHPVNMLMMGPGNYTFNDFLRVGAGMTLVTLVTLLAGMALFWGVG